MTYFRAGDEKATSQIFLKKDIENASSEPFGLHYSGPTQGGPGFTGHENDPESGFTYMQARYYDPGVGEFLSVDPVAPTPGDVFNFRATLNKPS